MLDFMRRNARSWGIKAALAVISLVFVFFMGGGGQIGAGPVALVIVDDIEISRPEFELARRRNENYFRQQFQGQINDEMLKSLNVPQMTLDQLVDGAVLRSEADRLGLVVTEDAIRDQLMRVPAFQSKGQFSPGLYRETLRAQGMTPGAFEETVRQELLEAQLADIVRRGAHVGEDEAWDAYQRENRRMTLSYVAIDADPFEKDVEVTDEALASFYEGKQENFRRPPSVRVRYIAYKVAEAAAKLEVSDVEMNEYYELNKNSEFQQEEHIGARHILKKVDKAGGEEAKKAARAAIEDIAKKLADGADFEALAKSDSDDVGSAASGGDLGLFGRGRMVPPFEEAAFALDVGQTSEIVESDFGFHIIRVYERKAAGVAPFEEVEDKVRDTLAMQQAVDRVFDDSAEDSARIQDGAAFDAVAAERGATIEETPLFSEGAIVPGIGPAPAFVEAAFSLASPGDVSQPVKVGGDYYVLSLSEREESSIPPLEEVREQVEADFREERALELAREHADKLLDELRSGAALRDLAAREQLELKQATDIGGRSNFVDGLGTVPGLSEVAFATTRDGEALARSFVSGAKACIFVRDGVTDVDREAFEIVKEDEIQRLEEAREQAALKNFIESLKRALQDDGAISYDLAALRPLLGDRAALLE